MIRGRSGGSSWTRRTQTEFSSPRWVMLTGRTRSEASSVRKIEERAGKKFSFTMKTPERSIWRSSQEIRKRFTRRCGRRAGHRGAFTLLRTDRAVAFIAQDGGEHWDKV